MDFDDEDPLANPRLANVMISITVIHIFLLMSNMLVYWVGAYGMLSIAIMVLSTGYGGWILYLTIRLANSTFQSRLVVCAVINLVGIVLYIGILTTGKTWTYVSYCTLVGSAVVLSLYGYCFYYIRKILKPQGNRRTRSRSRQRARSASYAPNSSPSEYEGDTTHRTNYSPYSTNYCPQGVDSGDRQQIAAPQGTYAPQGPYSDSYIQDITNTGGYPEADFNDTSKEKLEDFSESSSSSDAHLQIPNDSPCVINNQENPYNPYNNYECT